MNARQAVMVAAATLALAAVQIASVAVATGDGSRSPCSSADCRNRWETQVDPGAAWWAGIPGHLARGGIGEG